MGDIACQPQEGIPVGSEESLEDRGLGVKFPGFCGGHFGFAD